MAIGMLTQTSLRDMAVDFSYPYFYTRMGFFTKKPPTIPKLYAMFWPFKMEVWMSLAVALVAFTMVNLISSKVYKKRVRPSFNLGSVILQTCRMLAMQGMKDSLYLSLEGYDILFSSGINKWPITWKTKILLFLWICFSLFVSLGTIRTIRASTHPKH